LRLGRDHCAGRRFYSALRNRLDAGHFGSTRAAAAEREARRSDSRYQFASDEGHGLGAEGLLYTETTDEMGNTSGARDGSMISGARLDHVAFGVESMRSAAEFLTGTLGGSPHEGGPGPGYTGAQWKFANGARLELIEPLGTDGFLHRFIRAKGPRIHHVTFIVPNLAIAARSAEALGYDIVGYNDAYPSWKECFLHPKQALGIVVQMAEKSDAVDDGNTWSSAFAFPSAPSSGPMASVAALRLRAPSRASAVRQWVELLGAEMSERDDRVLRFRWPDSPIRIVVDVDASDAVGPRHIEVLADPRIRLPADPPPALGARFVRAEFHD
jgi:methylmalonyl-CoA/ethylmalonyl-CoA epimerase